MSLESIRSSCPHYLLVLSLAIGCTGPLPQFEGTVEPSPELTLDSARIVVVPVALPAELDAADSVGARLDSMIHRALEARDLVLYSSDQYSTEWERIVRASGGFFDPFTGERDDERYQAAINELRRRVTSGFRPTNWLFPEVTVTEAEVRRGRAQWDGVIRPIEAAEPFFLPANVLALTLTVELEDLQENVVFARGIGLEVFEEQVETDDGDFVLNLRTNILGDSVVTTEVIDQVLAPLWPRQPVVAGTN